MHHSHRHRPLRDTAARAGRGALARQLGVLGLLLLAPSLAVMAQRDSAGDAAGFKIIVNAGNPVSSMKASTIAKMFLKKVKRWDHDVSVTPLDLVPKSPARTAFTKSIHGKSVTAIKSFWQRMIFSGREEPPAEKSSVSEVLSIVRSTPGAIAYVPADTALDDGVKELEITP